MSIKFFSYKPDRKINREITRVLKAGQFIKGKEVEIFEQNLSRYMGCNVITCANGTDALMISLMALDLKPGDQVITTPFTFVSTAEVICHLGLKPVFVDIGEDFLIDTKQIESKVTGKTKAIIPVHLFGQCCNMIDIKSIARKYNFKIIEDACQSLGAYYKSSYCQDKYEPSGTIGDIGCTSFFPTKNLGCYGDGGAIFTKDNDLAKKIKSICNHGQSSKYYYERIGVNSRLDAIQAAVLNVKLKLFNQSIIERQDIAEYYDKHLRNIPVRSPGSTHTFHQYTIRSYKRDLLKEFLRGRRIETNIYYPLPIHLQKGYEFLGYKKGDFPVSEKMSETCLSLPMTVTRKEQDYIIESILHFE